MDRIKEIYDQIIGKHILTDDQMETLATYLPEFEENLDKYLYYDNSDGTIHLFTYEEMKNKYEEVGVYAYDNYELSVEYFITSSCIEVLKEFTEYNSLEAIHSLMDERVLGL